MKITAEKTKEEYLEKTVSRLKVGIRREMKRERWDQALSLLSACAALLYKANQSYTDVELEQWLYAIAREVLPGQEKRGQGDSILFYDGFGYNDRGLIQIYLRALCRLGHVIYVTAEANRSQLPDVLQILEDGGAETVWLRQSKPVAAMRELYAHFRQYCPSSAFLYTRPDDVAAVAVFDRMEGSVRRFQINLTDHAFWLGTGSMDYCVEFRDYGAVVSAQGRGIAEEKLVKLPFYPAIDRSRSFEGYPFPFDPQTQKLIFSGGSLYKTLGGGNRYYQLVEHILQTYPQTVFWYAGSGNRTQMDALISRFPGRAFLTAERGDFLQIIERSVFYLSTYPVSGGLMFQYAAAMGKLPITLKFDAEADGYLLGQHTLGIEATDMEQAKALIHAVLTDEAFRQEKETVIRRAVIDEETFTAQLGLLLREGRTDFPIAMYDIDVSDLRREYLMGISLRSVAAVMSSRSSLPLLACLPVETLAGAGKNIRDRLLRR